MIIRSGSFPLQMANPKVSENHQLLQMYSYKSQSITYRYFQKKDISQLKELHKQWFPVNYSDQFYQQIGFYNDINAIVAQVQLKKTILNKQKVIIGCIVYQKKRCKKRFFTYFSKKKCVYILTIGVMDQFRRQGIASELLKYIQRKSENDCQIYYIYLHMIECNESGKKFYFKQNFKIQKYYKQFYQLNHIYYGAYLLSKQLRQNQLGESYMMKIINYILQFFNRIIKQ